MYHEATLARQGYYDTMEEIPQVAIVKFPDGTTKEMTAEEMIKLDNEGKWYTIVHETNYGVCDHWTSWALTKWVEKRFEQIIRYVDSKGNTIGYRRKEANVTLTKNCRYWQSEVWNS